MKKIPQYVIDKAIELRVKHKMTVPEIAECLAVSKATVNGWMEDYPLEERTEKQGNAQKAAAKANRENAAKKRQASYDEAWEQAPELFENDNFREFICMYIGEGSKKARNKVSIVNSDLAVIVLSHFWILKLSNPENNMYYGVQIHKDHDEETIKIYWATALGIEAEIIHMMRKSNSGELSGRKFRSQWGLLTIQANDTYFMSKMQAWMDYRRKEWLDKYLKK
jgi:hypothetical protein